MAAWAVARHLKIILTAIGGRKIRLRGKLFGMRLEPMLFEKIFSIESYLADSTVIWSLVEVSSFVVAPISDWGKFLFTMMASERCDPCVGPQVDLQVAFFRKSFLAAREFTYKVARNLEVVDFVMHQEASFSFINPIANGTHGYFHSIVSNWLPEPIVVIFNFFFRMSASLTFRLFLRSRKWDSAL